MKRTQCKHFQLITFQGLIILHIPHGQKKPKLTSSKKCFVKECKINIFRLVKRKLSYYFVLFILFNT
jgi:hypothetical protein